MSACEKHYPIPDDLGDECPGCAMEERDRLKALIKELVESYDILFDESPLAGNDIARGVIRGAFIGTIDDARKATI